MKKSSHSNSGSALVWLLVLVAIGAAAYFLLAQKKSEAPKTGMAGLKEAAATQLEKAKEETAEAAASVKGYAFSQKAELVAKMQPKLDAMNAEIAEATAKLKTASAQAKAEAEPKLQALREQSAALGRQLEKVKGATADTWEDVKSGFQGAYDKAKAGLKDAKDWVVDKL